MTGLENGQKLQNDQFGRHREDTPKKASVICSDRM